MNPFLINYFSLKTFLRLKKLQWLKATALELASFPLTYIVRFLDLLGLLKTDEHRIGIVKKLIAERFHAVFFDRKHPVRHGPKQRPIALHIMQVFLERRVQYIRRLIVDAAIVVDVIEVLLRQSHRLGEMMYLEILLVFVHLASFTLHDVSFRATLPQAGFDVADAAPDSTLVAEIIRRAVGNVAFGDVMVFSESIRYVDAHVDRARIFDSFAQQAGG